MLQRNFYKFKMFNFKCLMPIITQNGTLDHLFTRRTEVGILTLNPTTPCSSKPNYKQLSTGMFLKSRICSDSQNHSLKLGVSLVEIEFIFMNTAFALLFYIILKTFGIKLPNFVIVGKYCYFVSY